MAKKKLIPGALWCYGGRDDGYTGWDCATREEALSEALTECDEAERIYLAQYTPREVELPRETNLSELLCQFSEFQELDETYEERLNDEKALADLAKRLDPLFEQLNVAFRGWLTDHGLEVLDFHNEEELSREQAQREVRDALSVHEARKVALAQVASELGWIEAHLRYSKGLHQEEAKSAIERIKAIVEEGGEE